jgi:hypothetical protein
MNAVNQSPRSSDIAALASGLVLVSSIINNLNTAGVKRDNIYVLAATIGLLASYLFNEASYKEAAEQQMAPGVTTFANELKMASSSIGLLSGVLSYWALLIEVSLRAQGISAPQTPGTGGNTTTSSALLAQ